MGFRLTDIKQLDAFDWNDFCEKFITERNTILKNTQQLKDLSRKWPKMFPSLRRTDSKYPQLWVKNIFALIRALYLPEQIDIDVEDIYNRFDQSFQKLQDSLSRPGASLIQSVYNILKLNELHGRLSSEQ